MSQSAQLPGVFLAFGFHINTSHSYRIDTPDERGFAKDLRIIRSILDTLDAANERGVPVCGVWDTEQLFSVEECLSVHAPELLERIRRRVMHGNDEVIHMSYNNGLVSAMNEQELETVLDRSRSNTAGSGLEDLFGKASPIVRPQEMMTTAGSFKHYRAHGIEAVCLYYSATPFDAMRMFVDPLDAAQAHNPLLFDRQGNENGDGESIRIIPTYHTVDLIEHVSLRHWIKELRRGQRSGSIDRDVLLFINFDADDQMWEGYDLPAPLRALPNTGGLGEMIGSVEDLEYVHYTTLAEYLETHSDSGTISFSQDTADGSWNGYSSWSEKYSSQLFYSAVNDDRDIAAAAGIILEELPERTRKVCESALQRSFEHRLRLLSTTAHGLATPFVAPAREEACVRLMNEIYGEHWTVVSELARALPELPVHSSNSAENVFVADIRNAEEKLVARLVYPGHVSDVENVGITAHVPEKLFEDIQSRNLHIECAAAPGGLKVQRTGQAYNKDTVRITLRSRPPAGGISEGLSLIDRDGGLVLAFRGQTLLTAESFVPSITYDQSRYIGTNVAISRDGSRGVVTITGSLSLPGAVNTGRFEWNLYEIVLGDAPMVFVDGFIEMPRTPADTVDRAGHEGLERSWDSRWKEIEACPLRLARVQYEDDRRSTGAIVSRANELGYRSSYKLDYHRRNAEHWYFASANNHLSQPYVAVSVNGVGLAVGLDQGVRSAFAGVPIRAMDPAKRRIPPGATTPGSVRTGRARVFDLNPLGTYHGEQWHPESWGSGVGTRVIEEAGEHLASSAPGYNGRRIPMSLVLAPFAGNSPREGVDNAMQRACRPATLFTEEVNGSGRGDNESAVSIGQSVTGSEIEALNAVPVMSRKARPTHRRGLPVSAGSAWRILLQSLFRRRLRFNGK